MRHDVAPTNSLHPFRALLRGSILVVGACPADLTAGLGDDAASVTRLDGGSALADDARFDVVLLLDPTRTPWFGAPGPASDRLDASLARARALLRPGGRLLVAIENALSLRHLAGGGEVAAASDLFSLEGRLRPDGFRLPSRLELRDRLARLGLTHQDWWFPFPDPDRPLSLIAERALATPGFDPSVLAASGPSSDPDLPDHGAFSLQHAWAGIARAGLMGDLAPGFLVLASDDALPEDARLALHFGLRRRQEFEKVVTFATEAAGIAITREPLHPGLTPLVGTVGNGFPDEPFVPGRLWQTELEALLACDGWTAGDIADWAQVWCTAVQARYADGSTLDATTRLPGTAIDAIPRNLLLHDGQPVFIDCEWDLGAPLEFGHLLLRALLNAFTDVEVCGRPGPGVETTLLFLVRAVSQALGVLLDDDAITRHLAAEDRFQWAVSGLEQGRTLNDLAAAHVRMRTLLADRLAERERAAQHFEAQSAALFAAQARHAEALANERRRTDRVVAYAADMDRKRQDLADTLDRMQRDEAARLESWRPRTVLRRLLQPFQALGRRPAEHLEHSPPGE
ncbi:hypothetical protein [Methylobacterium trifolii]|uniref:Aminoglycoside phosphotransferase domain-containing protein n=1 Tax=Methylobacterium trifolii TaxID=1003092 RepID=A0ABQ4TYD3_9HYPH|nr:hypothetical protein [Methylobacterium trifolii]GJE59733.1 hypothetical protein MPOCJGCO_1835 [Methylobacterium trifolii]